MEQNQIIIIPKKGDIVVIDNNSQVQFIALDTFSLARLTSGWTTVGVVANVMGDQVLIINKDFASKTWSDIYSWRLGGYTLDGTERTGVFSFRNGSSATQNTDVTFTYNTDDLDTFISALNDFFDDNMPAAEEWQAVKNGTNVDIILKYTYAGQAAYDTAKSGLTMTANLMPNVQAVARIRRKNGYIGGEGAISSWYRALSYYRSDNSSTTHNPSSEATLRRSYPICLPGYLGTSSYQSDHCSQLRAKYGEGEEGWLKFMKSCKPVVPSLVGNIGQRDGKSRTQVIASYNYIAKNGVVKPVSQAATYCVAVNYAADQLTLGNWYMPTPEEIAYILDDVKYNSHSSDRQSDAMNKALYLLGKSAISNGSSIWSCCRNGAYSAWLAYGGHGFFGYLNMCYSGLALPVTLYRLPQG